MSVTHCQCDLCRKRDLGVMYYHCETPVLFVCRTCEPKQFKEHATQFVFNAIVASLTEAAA